jgi:ABC-type hemin transport system substrate-binding protein
LARLLLVGCLAGLACDGEPSGAPGPLAPRGSSPLLRVVSLSPVASEFVLALGARPQLVGVDRESARLPQLEGLPSVGLEDVASLDPDLVIVPASPDPGSPGARLLEALRGEGADWIVFDPHSLEDVVESCRTLGARLVGSARALRFETGLARPLARLSGAAFGRARPRVLALVGNEPWEVWGVAGGHSFETDLIEIAGGASVTHGGSEPRLVLDVQQWPSLRPDVVVAMSPGVLGGGERAALRSRLPATTPLVFFPFDRSRFWLHDPAETAGRLQALLATAASEALEPAPGAIVE